MKSTFLILCLAVASCTALPAKGSHLSVLDLLQDLENVIQDDGKFLIEKMLTVIHYVENAVIHVKEIVPKIHEKIQVEANEVLDGLRKVTEEVQELLGKKKALFGFDLLNGLTELSGGTKLSTVLNLLSLADKAHRVMNDAKEFEPKLEKTLDRMQSRVETHVQEFASHVLKELGMQEFLGRSTKSKIQNLFDKVTEEGHALILDLMHKIEETFDILKDKFPEEYDRIEEEVEAVRKQIHDIIVDVEKGLVLRSYTLLDLAGNLSGGTSMSTAFKVMSLVDKFNTVVQDVKNFQPRSEAFLQRQVKKVAESAQTFFSHTADRLLQ